MGLNQYFTNGRLLNVGIGSCQQVVVDCESISKSSWLFISLNVQSPVKSGLGSVWAVPTSRSDPLGLRL